MHVHTCVSMHTINFLYSKLTENIQSRELRVKKRSFWSVEIVGQPWSFRGFMPCLVCYSAHCCFGHSSSCVRPPAAVGYTPQLSSGSECRACMVTSSSLFYTSQFPLLYLDQSLEDTAYNEDLQGTDFFFFFTR